MQTPEILGPGHYQSETDPALTYHCAEGAVWLVINIDPETGLHRPGPRDYRVRVRDQWTPIQFAPQAPAPVPVPAWTYQAPKHPSTSPLQCYYRAAEFHDMLFGAGSYVDGAASLQLFRWADSAAGCRLEVSRYGQGSCTADLTTEQLLQLRDACNDALRDIAQAEDDRLRRESLDEIRADMELAREMGLSGPGAYYAHPDVHYVATEAEVAPKLRSIKVGIVIVDPSVAQATAAEA